MFINICKSVWFSLKFADFLFKPIVSNLDISNAGLGTSKSAKQLEASLADFFVLQFLKIL